MKTVMMLQSKQNGKTIDIGGPQENSIEPRANIFDGAPRECL